MRTTHAVISLAVLLAVGVGFAAVATAQACDTSALRTAALGQRSVAVKNLQLCLIQSGYTIPAGATGYYGTQTAAAVKNFYKTWYSKFWDGLRTGPLGIEALRTRLAGGVAPVASEQVKPFTSADDFKNYLKRASELGSASYRFSTFGMPVPPPALPAATVAGGISAVAQESSAPVIERASETNVQVSGIDEPDIAKTDGKEIYFSGANPRVWWGWGSGPVALGIAMPVPATGTTKLIKALPVADIAVDGKIEKSGDLLLYQNTLAVFSGSEIVGYSVADPKNPAQAWTIRIENNNQILGARLISGRIYLVTKTYINQADPCPIRPLTVGTVAIEIPCARIFHPVTPVPTDVTFTVSVIDMATGTVSKTNSFVGSSAESLLYVSPSALYITTSYDISGFRVLAGTIRDSARDLFPASIIDTITKLEGYDISDFSRATELNQEIEKVRASLDQDARLKFNNELANRQTQYLKNHKRDLERTVITKVRLETLDVAASGSVAGRPLNQFSLDEYQGNLRVATTIGRNLWGATGPDSESDVYVLSPDFALLGSVRGLGYTERIYSVRFVADRGYVVTFRQTDPFYVLDLSSPTNPTLAGELKIPGFSSYLHPIRDGRILGVGREGQSVKLSLFDVSDPANPKEAAKYNLDDYWTEVSDNHHAFLHDAKHQVFFLPGGKGGYVFSYANDELKLVKTVADTGVKRAVYVNDYLYILSTGKVSVLDENTWEKVKEVSIAD